jgi:hypothetical protein
VTLFVPYREGAGVTNDISIVKTARRLVKNIATTKKGTNATALPAEVIDIL